MTYTKVPLIWMDSLITPTYKPGKTKTDPAAYRPISVTCTLGRVFERAINNAMDSHLERNSLIHESQHGFRRGRSCETNLLVLMEYHAQVAEEGNNEDNCYFDHQAFFDGIPHQRCLASLNAHGVLEEGKIHKWITAWLRAGGELEETRRQEPGELARSQELKLVRRRQQVILNGKASKWHYVTASIVQGSVLGPTLAKTFSNSSHQGRNLQLEDKPLVSKFPDDEKRCRIVNTEEQKVRMQEDINHMVSWSQRMGVELNEDKAHLLHIGQSNTKKPYTLGEGGPVIKAVDKEKDLGVLISSDLKPEKMVANQVQKAHAKLSQFNSTFTYRGKTWLNLYKTYVIPLYASEAWRPTTQEGIDKLESVQKRAIRMARVLAGKDYKDACRRAGMSTIQEELEEKDMVRTYRIMNGYYKVEKTTFWKMAEAREGPGRRRFKEKEVCRTIAAQRKPIRKQSFASRVQDPWNQLKDRVKLARNPKAFRSELKKAKNIT